MDFIREFGTVELVFCAVLTIAYLLYASRLFRIAKVLDISLTIILGKLILRTIYLGLFLTAALGPYYEKNKGDTKVKAVSKDIFLALDLSLSMNAQDVPPSRLDRSKYAISEIIKSFSTDKIGLVVFSSDAFLQCPLTYDKSALRIFLNTANSNIVPHNGTDLYKPLHLSLEKHLKNTDTKQAAKIIILFSDGEDFGENMEDIAEDVRKEGIKVFTVGIGTKKGSKILTSKGFKTDKDGNEVVTSLNRRSLKEIARITRGKYYEINESKSDLKKLISDIENIKGQVTDVDSISARNKNLKYHYFLLIGLLLLIIDVLFASKTFRI